MGILIDQSDTNVDGDESLPPSKSSNDNSDQTPTLAKSENGGICLEEAIEGELEEAEAEEEVSHPAVNQTTTKVASDPLNRNLYWTGHLKQTPVLLFSPSCVYGPRDSSLVLLGQRYHLTFKMVRVDCKLVRSLFEGHGFREASSFGPEYNIMWTGSHLKPYLLRGMAAHQRINHFPRSYELTRKDRLFKNIQRLQHVKGFKHFDFIPQSYVLPHEYQDFCTGYLGDKGPYIVKPIASSRGRGIYLVNHPEQVPADEHIIVSKYVNKPYLIDGFKFDIRLYVSVTSYDPLIIYLYEEGLVRFATVPYHSDAKYLDTQCMHLTNYSINKKNEQFVQNDDADVEDFGNKWSLGALLRYLRCEGRDVTALMLRLEDVIIKTLISVELPVSTACKMFQPHRGSCFELYGFDIILDEDLRPWLLEVNLSPSLACDSPLDLKIKSHMISHLLSLVGLICVDPFTQQMPPPPPDVNASSDSSVNGIRRGGPSARGVSRQRKLRIRGSIASATVPQLPPCGNSMSTDDVRMVRRAREEFQRRGGWLRIFPTKSTWDNYATFLQSNNPSNLLLHQRLFPGLWSERERSRGHSATLTNLCGGLKTKIPLHSLNQDALMEENASGEVNNSASLPIDLNKRIHVSYACVRTRLTCYERKLDTPCTLRRSRSYPSNRRPRVGHATAAETNPSSKTLSCDDVSALPKPPEVENNTQEKSSTVSASEPCSEKQDDVTSAASDISSIQTVRKSTSGASVDEENIDWDDYATLISHGGQMTKFQARHTFTAYLSSVQRRLLEESEERSSLTPEEEAVASEQMDLVVKFLRRASNHMSQPYRVHVPSRRLPVYQRKRVLSNVLNDFIHVYAKETITQRPRMRATETNAGVNNRALIAFLTNATEKELEQMLATYTHSNKSAGIFIDAGANGNAQEASGNHENAYESAAIVAEQLAAGDGHNSRRSRQSQRSQANSSSRSRSSSARSRTRSAREQRSRSAESPRLPRPRVRPRTSSLGPSISSDSMSGTGSRSRISTGRLPTERPPAGPSARRPLPARSAGRRRPPISSLVSLSPAQFRRADLALRLSNSSGFRSSIPSRLSAATCAIYSRPPTAPSPPRLSRMDRRETSPGIATGRRLSPPMPTAVSLVAGGRRLVSGRQRRTGLSMENIYDKITYDPATGLTRLRRQVSGGRRLRVE